MSTISLGLISGRPKSFRLIFRPSGDSYSSELRDEFVLTDSERKYFTGDVRIDDSYPSELLDEFVLTDSGARDSTGGALWTSTFFSMLC